ncbi:MAG: TonB-dependent receptor plug domain-containing protein [Gemmatimonadaceae bacterium]|nr:TonB-dependent receptor plug domain-containing protein [Gemmatimonadaceae bacterium]NUQ91860.1 TonB-dependent receptor plug domain-containing protein [Gemmatimonadaceae bacterium]NUR20495.1 TonB-dependent receptor plug domain-containing protein [Gemmatimonadaceae bacterium]NUS99000.1 TonB-dependent receptor plug domain-containing protein [Gemmatimonadaceae bacterium]
MNPTAPRELIALATLAGCLAACAPAAKHKETAPAPQVTSADLNNSVEPIEVVLQRKVPGAVVTKTSDGGISLRIRGGGAFTQGQTYPLYVLDGMPLHAGPNGAVPGLDPYDIETIRVLKGADAAIYGMDGADGVIIITTKQGPKQKPKSK